MAAKMFTLGPVVLEVPALAATEATRTARHRWMPQERLGARPGWQWLGPGEETMTLSGVSIVLAAGTADAVSALRSAAADGEALPLSDGDGQVLGRWAVRSIEERRRGIMADGTPRRVSWRLELALAEAAAEPPPSPALAAEGFEAVAALESIELLRADVREDLAERVSTVDKARELVRKGATWRSALEDVAGDAAGELEEALGRAGLQELPRRLWGPRQLLSLAPRLPGESLTADIGGIAGG